ncbi:hypothetical protein PO909_029856 [Leuciscus waleckii]
MLTVVPSRRGCTSDTDCSGGHKCCQFPCGPACVPPVFTKPGECPSTKTGRGNCAELCYYDSDCPNNEKCCSNGCGHECMAPYTGSCIIFGYLVFGSAFLFSSVPLYNSVVISYSMTKNPEFSTVSQNSFTTLIKMNI